MTDIIPAIMPDSYDDLVSKASRVKGLVPIAQIDIMDGVFVASKSWPYTEGGVAREPHFVAMSHQDEGLPFWDEIDFEIDLMIAEPEKHIEEWYPLGASRLIVHIEAIKDRDAFFSNPMLERSSREIGGELAVAIGLAIDTATPLSEIEPYLEKVDFVQCMGIAKIGYQKQPFDERVLTHIERLRAAYPELIISIDGGVNVSTAPILVRSGANRLVAGSAIFGAPDAAEAIRTLASA
ncbi:MAG TPA: hypothetical protein VLB83_05375 [Candidatus Paceibacterota bacterium]|nr:hypothetical protein [Candidatus Paceibacterota bacterium]